MRELFSLIFIILGTFIGAGIISGKEIAVYFTNYSYYIIMVILASVAIIFLMCFFCKFGKKYHVRDFTDYSKILFGKYSPIINILFVVGILCMVGNMIAGLDIVLFNVCPNTLIINLVLVFIIYLVISHDIKGIEVVNAFLVPLMLFFIIYLSMVNIDILAIQNTMHMYDFSIFKVIIYIFLNILDISIILCQISKNYSNKSIYIASVICGTIIAVLAILESWAMMSNKVLGYDFPMLEIANMFDIGVVYFAVSVSAMLTTLISAVFIIYSYISRYFGKLLSTFIISCLGIIISMFGFTFIISYIYIFIGVLGAVLFMRTIYIYYFSEVASK